VLLFSCHPEFMDIMAAVHRDPRYSETAVASFAITDKVISRVPILPGDGQCPPYAGHSTRHVSS